MNMLEAQNTLVSILNPTVRTCGSRDGGSAGRTGSSGYRVTESDERVQLVIDRRQYPRVVSGKSHTAQTSTPHVAYERGIHPFTTLTHIAVSKSAPGELGELLFENLFARALSISLLTHSP